jgi:hypothetical protein
LRRTTCQKQGLVEAKKEGNGEGDEGENEKWGRTAERPKQDAIPKATTGVKKRKSQLKGSILRGRTRKKETKKKRGEKEDEGRGRQRTNGQPRATSDNVSLDSCARLRSDRSLPVRLIVEDGREVSNEVDDHEDETCLWIERQVGAVEVSLDRVLLASFDEHVVPARRKKRSTRFGKNGIWGTCAL